MKMEAFQDSNLVPDVTPSMTQHVLPKEDEHSPTTELVHMTRLESSNHGDIIPDLILRKKAKTEMLDHRVEQEDNSMNVEDDYRLYMENYKPPEPNYSKANSLPFYTLCRRLELLWLQRKLSNSHKQSKEKLLDWMLPKKLFQYLEGGSPFPLFRLLMPDRDTLRPHSGLKEKMIAKLWGDALGLSKRSSDYQKIVNFNDPFLAGSSCCGDISLAIHEVVLKRIVSRNSSSDLTIGQVNQLLDDLVMIKTIGLSNNHFSSSNSKWMQMSMHHTKHHQDDSKTNKTGSKKQLLRLKWVEGLIAKGISALEHKWIVRILLQRLDIGLGSESIIQYYHPWAPSLYSANKNIRTLCATLCDTEYIHRRKERLRQELNMIENHNRMSYMPKSAEAAKLGSTIAPMLSMRTSFKSFLSDIQKRHRAFINALPKDSPLRSSLNLKFPAFTCEIKMDGERIISHVQRGKVTMQTRNAVWYSKIYSPVLGPCIRKALEKYDVDVILDGEVVSWDDARKEIIPFGANRAVAKARREWCLRNGLLDSIDMDLHDINDGVNIMNIAETTLTDVSHDSDFQDAGKECWLKYVVFDVLYINGPDAEKVISKACGYNENNLECGGSILNRDLFQRKSILHHLLSPLDNMVEIVQSIVVRPDGTCMDGQTYFSSTTTKDSFGFAPMVLDSINDTITGTLIDHNKRFIIDLSRRSKTDKEIDEERARAVERYYDEIVGDKCCEGVIFKDLASPYGLGTFFRNKGYWFKLKDDYEERGHASDIDVIVLGASFATGMRKAGILNRFLVGCLDDSCKDEMKFLTLCTINGGGTSQGNLERILESTGFRKNPNGEIELGHWFKSEDKNPPDFISTKSFQRSMNGDYLGWTYKRLQWPDLWIEPDKSFILTVYAGEIVISEDHSSGVSLRFPRISKIRAEGFGDVKALSDIETATDLHARYFDRLSSRKTSCETSICAEQKFLTIGQYNLVSGQKKPRARKRSNTETVRAFKQPRVSTVGKTVFAGYSFSVLEGTYTLPTDSIDAEEAKCEGWFDVVTTVSTRQDVIDYIGLHGGICTLTGNLSSDFIVGGSSDDARVSNYLRNAPSVNAVDSVPAKRYCSWGAFAQAGCVLKWTFLYRAVHKLRSTDNNNLRSIVDDIELIPRKDDFLFLPSNIEAKITAATDVGTIFDLKRLLSQERFINSSQTMWQYRGILELNNDEKWILEGPRQKLWLSSISSKDLDSSGTKHRKPVIIYPQIFDTVQVRKDLVDESTQVIENNIEYSNLGDSETISSIPLLKAMGAVISPTLHEGVTHILCELNHHVMLKWGLHTSSFVHSDPIRGAQLHSYLRDMQMERAPFLITSSWVRSLWGN